MEEPRNNERGLSSCPYKGLIPYGEEDAEIFFGREDWCTIITNNLLASHLTLLYGASGVGKSSVLLAGVANRLKKQARHSVEAHGRPEWAVIVCRDWRDDPLATLRKRISTEMEALTGRALPEQKDSGSNLSSLLEACSQAIATVHDDGSRSPGKLLLILDQFEEYFLYHPQESGTGSFFEEFPQAVNDSRLSLNVLISLREDSLAKLDRFKQQLPDLFANRLQIDHLDRAAAIDAIRKPIEEYNRHLPPDCRKASVEPALIQAVLEQVKVGQIQTSESESNSDQPSRQPQSDPETLRVETPFLQLVMTRLWEEESCRQTPPRLRQETLEQLGGASTIVREHLVRLMEGLSESSKRVAAVIFDKLVTSGLTKIAYPVFELTDPTKVDRPEDLVKRSELQELLEHLSSGSQRILRRLPPALEQPDAEERYEIFHDVLAKPILEWRRSFRETADRQEERERYAQALHQERQRRNRNLWISGIIGAPLLVATIVLWQMNVELTAKEQELTVVESAQQFKGQQRDQIDALVQAMAAAHTLQQRNATDIPGAATNIGADLRHILDHISEVTKVDLLSPKDASARLIRFHPNGKLVGIVFQNNQFDLRDFDGKSVLNHEIPERLSTATQKNGEGVASFAFARTGGRWATISRTGMIRIWTGNATRPIHSVPMAGRKGLTTIGLRNRLHFSPDGQRLAVIDQEDDGKGHPKGVLRILDLSAPPSRLTAEPLGEASSSATPSLALVRFSPKGDVLATATAGGEILLFNALTGRRLPSPTSDERALRISSLEFASNGEALAASSPNGLRVWHRDSQGAWRLSRIPANTASQLRFSPDPEGTLLAAGSLDAWARIWDVRDPENPKQLTAFLNQAPVQDVRFLSDGGSLLTVSTAGRLHQWTVPALPKPTGLAPQTALTAAAFDPDGRWLAQATLGKGSVALCPVASVASGCSGTPLPLTSSDQPTAGMASISITRLAFNRQASAVAGLPWRGDGVVWDRQGQRLQTLRIPNPYWNPSDTAQKTTPLSGPFSEISFDPDGQQFAVVARGGDTPQLLLCPAQRMPNPGVGVCKSLGLPDHLPEESRMAKLISSFRQFAFGRGFAMADKQTNTSKPTVTSVQFLPEPGFKLLLSMDNGQICSATRGEQADQLRFLHCDHGVKRQGSWWQLSASADGSTIGLAGFDGTLDLFRRGSRDRLRKLLKQPIKASAGPLQTVSIEKEGRYLAIVALNGTASLWDNKGRQLASFSTDDVASGGFLKAAFIADGSKLLLVTKEGLLQEKAVEDLPRLLDRGCETLRIFLNNPTTDTATKKRLSFCKV